MTGSPLEFLTMVLRHKWTILAAGVGLGTVAGVHGRVTGGYVADAQFAPGAGAASPSGVAGLAAQFGFSIGAGPGDESLSYYTDLLRSRSLLIEVARIEYDVALHDGADTVRGTLVDLLKLAEDDDEDSSRVDLRAADRLREVLAVAIDADAGIITVRAEMPWPSLAEAVVAQLLDRLNRFNRERRQSRAAAERRFVEQQVNDARQRLDEAELALQRFLDANRQYRDSPRLEYEVGRLERQVNLRQQVYSGLVQAYEQARIEEVRDTPVITVIDTPQGSARASVNLPRRAVMGGLLGVVLAIGGLLGRDYVAERRRIAPGEVQALRSALPWPWRPSKGGSPPQ